MGRTILRKNSKTYRLALRQSLLPKALLQMGCANLSRAKDWFPRFLDAEHENISLATQHIYSANLPENPSVEMLFDETRREEKLAIVRDFVQKAGDLWSPVEN